MIFIEKFRTSENIILSQWRYSSYVNLPFNLVIISSIKGILQSNSSVFAANIKLTITIKIRWFFS